MKQYYPPHLTYEEREPLRQAKLLRDSILYPQQVKDFISEEMANEEKANEESLKEAREDDLLNQYLVLALVFFGIPLLVVVLGFALLFSPILIPAAILYYLTLPNKKKNSTN